MKTIFKYVIFGLVVALAVVLLCMLLRVGNNKIETESSHIADLKSMVQLCTVELYNEVPILDTINNKVLFAVQKQYGSISFDIENLQSDTLGDTVTFFLPPEIVEIYESTDDESWQVIDTKSLSVIPFAPSKLSNDEENAIKTKIKRKMLEAVYKNGTVEHARQDALLNLKSLMEKLYQRPVVVIDTTPQGSRPNNLTI